MCELVGEKCCDLYQLTIIGKHFQHGKEKESNKGKEESCTKEKEEGYKEEEINFSKYQKRILTGSFLMYNNSMPWYKKLSYTEYFLIIISVIMIVASVLFLMGRIPFCECGYVKLWHGVVYSSENSQHLTDWYTITHVIHGFIFYAVFRWIGKRRGWPVMLSLLLAVLLEGAWEILENTDFIINRYREVTISLDYFGDSIINSVSDIFAMMFGFFMASRIRVSLSILFIIALEVFLGVYIRDNLTINIIMLLYPLESLKAWQSLPKLIP